MAKRRLMAVAVLITVVSVIIATLEITKRPYAKVESPDGNIRVTVAVKGDTPEAVYTFYNVEYKGETLIDDSGLGITTLDGGYLGKNVEIYSHRSSIKDIKLTPASGAGDTINSQYSELVVNLHERIQPFRNYYLVFRVFNDGIAYRYVLTGSNEITGFDIVSENSEFRFTSDIAAFSFPDSVESEMIPFEINPGTALDLPLIIRINDRLYTAIMEAGQADQTGMKLAGDDNDPFMLKSKSANAAAGQDVRYSGETPLETPWRIILISDDTESLKRSDIISVLNSREDSEK
ncbi:MAG: hypothetical protein GY863_21300 [bacterium]|nr:hypothetical protein [bacterium]